MKEVLQEIVNRVPGALGAAVVGFDGIPVEKVAIGDGVNIDLVSAEGVGVVRRAVIPGRDSLGDRPEELTINRRSGTTILRWIGSDYYLCVVLGPDAIPGQARYEAWRAGLKLEAAIG